MKLVAIGCLIAMPLLAQTTTTTTTTTTTKTKHTTRSTNKARVHDEAARLAALLDDAQTKAMLSPAAWKAVANEANALANKIYANTGGRADAKDLRAHVRKMHAAAMKGDADGAKTHAGEALPYAYKIIDWAS